VESAHAAIVADLGSGAFANLIRFRAPDAIDAVVISHMHADHFIDLVPLRYALRYGARANDRRVALYLPPGGEAILRAMVAPFNGESGAFLDDVFALKTYDPHGSITVGDIAMRFAPTTHYIACHAMRFAIGSATLVYSADTAPDATLATFAHDADVLICEATLAPEEEALEPRGHLSAREAGELAATAGAKSLILSHYPATAKPADMSEAAALAFRGRIRVVDDADRFTIGEL
jgi:ribonuclease BN (tRNA processing enzyme)